MLVTLTTTTPPATDLGFLLHKHPDKVQTFAQNVGEATVFFPRAEPQRCTAALLLEVDPVELTRTARKSPDFALGQYVNDRPYAASSLLAVALGKVFSTARSGRCKQRQELADTAIDLEVDIAAVPCRGGPDIARRLFAPLGWNVETTSVALNTSFRQWGDSRYVNLRLSGTMRLAQALNHLYVLLPVLDDSKHYWVNIAEVDKLVRGGGDWLAVHPDRDLITRRYLARQRGLERVALARLAEVDESGEELEQEVEEEPSADQKRPRSLNDARRAAVLEEVTRASASSVIDLGCGSGKLLEELLNVKTLHKVAGVDVSTSALRMAARRLRLDSLNPHQAQRLEVFQGALTYIDERFAGYDVAVLMEVIEHLDEPRLPALARVVFGAARPGTVIVTTPNVEYNVNYELSPGQSRHGDHRFEWDRARFRHWVDEVAGTFGYTVKVRGVGELDQELGYPTQMGVFTRG